MSYRTQINMVKCVYICVCVISSVFSEVPGNHKSPVAVSTASNQILVSKYSPTIGSRVPSRSGWFQSYGRESINMSLEYPMVPERKDFERAKESTRKSSQWPRLQQFEKQSKQ